MSAPMKTPSRLGSLVLAWLLSQQDGGTPHQITKALQTLRDEREGEDERRHAIDAEVSLLTQAGWVTHVRKAALTLTAGGRRAALAALEWKTLPSKADWRSIKKRLSALALEQPRLPLEDEKADEKAAILARHHGLAIAANPTRQQLYDAFLWRALNVETAAPFTVPAAVEALFNQMLGSSSRLSLEQALEQLVARVAKVSTPLPKDDGAFAARVLEAARGTTTGRFGDDKVFISHVLRQLEGEGTVVGDTEVFKERLVAAHRRGLLSLSRADLVDAMTPADVEASESRYLSATFHFVRI